MFFSLLQCYLCCLPYGESLSLSSSSQWKLGQLDFKIFTFLLLKNQDGIFLFYVSIIFFLSDSHILVSTPNNLHESRDQVYFAHSYTSRVQQRTLLVDVCQVNEWVVEWIHKWICEWNCISLSHMHWNHQQKLSFSDCWRCGTGLTWSVSRPWISIPIWIIAQRLVNKNSMFHPLLPNS